MSRAVYNSCAAWLHAISRPVSDLFASAGFSEGKRSFAILFPQAHFGYEASWSSKGSKIKIGSLCSGSTWTCTKFVEPICSSCPLQLKQKNESSCWLAGAYPQRGAKYNTALPHLCLSQDVQQHGLKGRRTFWE